ncbi:MAG TPA: hypothetical protein VF132_01870 [Rudaea sp.]
MRTIRLVSAVFVLLLLTACSGSNQGGSNPADTAARAPPVDPKAAIEAKAAKELALYDQMRTNRTYDLAATLGDELIRKYPDSASAAKAKETLEDVRAKATAQTEARRLARLWAYAASPEAGGTQYTAAIASKDPIGIANAKVRLVLRQHPKWGQSVYLLLDNATFDCRKGCATLPVAFDDAPAQRMKAVIPPTGEPALFIDDDKGFIARMEKAKKVAITATLKNAGEKTFVFEVGGYDPAKLPEKPKK